MKEGLRLHPPAPLVVRTFQEGCEVKGFYIPEKTTLVVNGYAVMRDPDVWEDPEEFKPERFLATSRSGQEEDKTKGLRYIPFGSGRRLSWIKPGLSLSRSSCWSNGAGL